MAQIDTATRFLIEEKLRDIFTSCESQRGVIVPLNVRAFFADFVTEAMIFRASEWQLRTGLDLDQPRDREQSIVRAADTVANILFSASTFPSVATQPLVSLIGVLEQIQKNWCGIFPFCR